MVSISGAARQPTSFSAQSSTAPASKIHVRVKAGDVRTETPLAKDVGDAQKRKAQLMATTSVAALAAQAAMGAPAVAATTGAAVALAPYPEVARGNVVDDYFGVKVADPYRALESNPKAAAAFDRVQNEFSHAYLSKLPARPALEAYLQQLYSSSDTGAERKVGDWTYYTKRNGGDEQAALYVRANSDGGVRCLFNPVDDDPTGTLAIGGYNVSPDGKHVAVGVSDNGSDWATWYVFNPADGTKLADTIRWTKATAVTWLPDGSGFYYTGLPQPAAGQELLERVHDAEVRFHKIGTDQAQDIVCAKTADKPNVEHDISLDKDANLELLQSGDLVTGEMTFSVRPLGDLTGAWKQILRFKDANYQLDEIVDATHIRFITDKDAPNRKLIELDISTNPPVQRELLAADADGVLQSVQVAGERVYASYLVNGTALCRVYHNGQVERTIQLPDRGTVSRFWGDDAGKEAHFTFQNIYTPATDFKVDLTSGKRSITKAAEIPVDTSAYVMEEHYYTSTDGTRVPMWVARRRDAASDPDAPCLMYAYGGFDVDITSTYSRRFQALMDAGVTIAIPQIRGGGERGENWHRSGRLLNKQNVFEDFKQAAHALIAQDIAKPGRISAAGDSNGGYLMGEMLIQASDLFACILAGVGVQDQLRYPLYTWGPGWVPEYGDAAHSERDFKNLIGLSPVHNFRKGAHYTTTLFTTGTSDDRVPPMHSRKAAAAAQWAQGGDKPILFRIDPDTGHGAGKPVSKLIALTADQFALALDAMHANDYAQKLTERLAHVA